MDIIFRDRVLLIGAISLVVIFLLDFFRINLTNNVTEVTHPTHSK